tara:strand:- start:1892 stop:2356 length:465 start_codon:yes stop_codon:yes gene_type:complete
MAQKYSKILISLFFIFSIAFISCEDNKNISDQEVSNKSDLSKNIENSKIASPQGLPPGIPSFPYIFYGNFFISNEKGPDNTKIYAKLGELDSPVVETKDGIFKNLIIGPRTDKDTEFNIEFFILKEDGTSIKAKEEIPFEITPTIKNSAIDLHF